MNIFFVSDLSKGSIALNKEESRHCIKVLRLKKGDPILVMNGKGSRFHAIIENPDSNACQVTILDEERRQGDRLYHLTIAIAPTKNIDRFEWFLEKSTEIGIDRIVPIICQHSERKEIKTERLEKILISAIKQSGQLFLPELTPPVPLKNFIRQSFEGDKFIAHCDAGEKRLFKDSLSTGKNVLVLIGPEGDFDSVEIKLALEQGYVPVSLGESRLRTETAGIVACHTVCLVNQ
ncbi:MAG TPA: 16S rRNA (uracil(1498)-N(3))-methyltransferase [Prolixibacteraceae bacterium]